MQLKFLREAYRRDSSVVSRCCRFLMSKNVFSTRNVSGGCKYRLISNIQNL